MSDQRTLASVMHDSKKKVTRRERFPREMDAVILWATLRALVAPHYTKPGRRIDDLALPSSVAGTRAGRPNV